MRGNVGWLAGLHSWELLPGGSARWEHINLTEAEVSAIVWVAARAGSTSDGAVMAAGRTAEGACKVTNWAKIVAVAASPGHTLGLCSEGNVLAAGDIAPLGNVLSVNGMAQGSETSKLGLDRLMICNVEDQWFPKGTEGVPGEVAGLGWYVEGARLTSWEHAINQMMVAYPERFEPYL